MVIIKFVMTKLKVNFKYYFSSTVNYFFIPLIFSNYHHIALKIYLHSIPMYYYVFIATLLYFCYLDYFFTGCKFIITKLVIIIT